MPRKRLRPRSRRLPGRRTGVIRITGRDLTPSPVCGIPDRFFDERKHREMNSETDVQSASLVSHSDTFYLVLHGEIAIFDSCKPEDHISLYTPDILEHVFMAGAWLGEQRIPACATLNLTGVNAGYARIA